MVETREAEASDVENFYVQMLIVVEAGQFSYPRKRSWLQHNKLAILLTLVEVI